MVDRLVGANTIADLKKRVLPAALRDVTDWHDTWITIRRRDESEPGGWKPTVTTRVISIGWDDTQPRIATGGAETSATGSFKFDAAGWEDDTILPDDRFEWDGRVCVVTSVLPVKLDAYVPVMFRSMEG